MSEQWVEIAWQPPLVYSKAAFAVIEDSPMPFDPQDILWDEVCLTCQPEPAPDPIPPGG